MEGVLKVLCAWRNGFIDAPSRRQRKQGVCKYWCSGTPISFYTGTADVMCSSMIVGAVPGEGARIGVFFIRRWDYCAEAGNHAALAQVAAFRHSAMGATLELNCGPLLNMPHALQVKLEPEASCVRKAWSGKGNVAE